MYKENKNANLMYKD